MHHILVHYLEYIWEPKFIYHSYACRKEKGACKAIGDLRKYIRELEKENDTYYLQLDIQSFFVSLRKDILFDLIKKYVKDPEILWLADVIIFHNPVSNYSMKGNPHLFKEIPPHKSLFKVPPNQGLPIGNLTSQFFANVYMNEFDQFVKHKLKIRYYLRYVDDFIILSNDKEQLKLWREEIKVFLWERLRLKIHPKKQILLEVVKGINFVGYIVKPEYVLTRRRVVKSLKYKIYIANQNIKILNEEDITKLLSVFNSYYGQFKHSNSFGLRRNLYEKDFGELRKFFEPVDNNFSYFKINEKIKN